MKEPRYEILMASHKEPIHWLELLPEQRNYRLTVSNSSGITEAPGSDRLVSIPNAGREAGHYLRFIIDNYDNLLPVTVFLQADPWVHTSHSGGAPMLDVFFGNPCFDHPFAYIGVNPVGPSLEPMEGSPAHKVLSSVWGVKGIPKGIPFAVGAQFYVKREAIRSMPVEHYEKALEFASDSSLSLAHALEPHWGAMFKLT